MIIVEGLDNTGKTTLVEKLVSDFPQLDHVPSIGNTHPPGEEIKRQAWDAIDQDRTNPLRLWDRSRFISEYIYNPVLQSRPLAFDHSEWFLMLSHFFNRPHLLIYCSRPIYRIRSTLDERDQLGGVADNLPPLSGAYEVIMDFFRYMFHVKDVGSEFVRYDFEDRSYELPKQMVQDYIERVSE